MKKYIYFKVEIHKSIGKSLNQILISDIHLCVYMNVGNTSVYLNILTHNTTENIYIIFKYNTRYWNKDKLQF